MRDEVSEIGDGKLKSCGLDRLHESRSSKVCMSSKLKPVGLYSVHWS